MPYQELCGALADAEAYLYEHNDSLNSARERERDKERVHVCVFLGGFICFFVGGCPQEWGRHYCKLMLVQVVSDIFKLKERENRKG